MAPILAIVVAVFVLGGAAHKDRSLFGPRRPAGEATGEPTEEARPVPTIAAVQTDIGFANKFRPELVKLILTLAPALLAFTVAFRPTHKNPVLLNLLRIGWPAIGLATVGASVPGLQCAAHAALPR